MRRLPKPKEKKKEIDPGLFAAMQVANYQLQCQKEAVRVIAINKEVDKLCDRHVMDVEDQFSNWLYGAFALALHRHCKFGAKRIADVLHTTQSVKNELKDSGMDSEEIWQIVADEIGLVVGEEFRHV